MFCSMHKLFVMLSSPAPIDLSLYHHADSPTLMYITRVGDSSGDVLLHFVLVIERVQR